MILMWACSIPDSKVRGANVGPIWGRPDPGGPHVGPMNLRRFNCPPLVMLECYNNVTRTYVYYWIKMGGCQDNRSNNNRHKINTAIS